LIVIYGKGIEGWERKKAQFSGTSKDGTGLLLEAANLQNPTSGSQVPYKCNPSLAQVEARRKQIEEMICACRDGRNAWQKVLQVKNQPELFRNAMTPFVQRHALCSPSQER
jgi:hypothetical protein